MKINVCGCGLVDNLYTDISFASEKIKPYLSVKDGDGGIAPGKLVFTEDLETFAKKSFDTIARDITGGVPANARNIGGPALVGAINAAQILYNTGAKISFYGAGGKDNDGAFILDKTPMALNMDNYAVYPDAATPTTVVLSDPSYHNGKGERSFLNRIGAAWNLTPERLGNAFFDADILWFAATALTPNVHDALTELLKRGKAEGKYNLVSTVFDFRSEKADPVGPWKFGESDESYQYVDVLIVDCDEALRLSGTKKLDDAFAFFQAKGVSALFVTYGAKDFFAWSDGRIFQSTGNVWKLPVSALADKDLAEHPERRGDTTGCGDNFAGGIVASFIRQKQEGVKDGELSVLDAAAWAAASGGAALFCKGGTFFESHPGEKLDILKRYAEDYLQSVHGT